MEYAQKQDLGCFTKEKQSNEQDVLVQSKNKEIDKLEERTKKREEVALKEKLDLERYYNIQKLSLEISEKKNIGSLLRKTRSHNINRNKRTWTIGRLPVLSFDIPQHRRHRASDI